MTNRSPMSWPPPLDNCEWPTRTDWRQAAITLAICAAGAAAIAAIIAAVRWWVLR